MDKTQSGIVGEALSLIAERLDALEARRMADGLLLQALIDSLPDKTAFMASAEDMITRLPDLMSTESEARTVQGAAVHHMRAALQALRG